MVDNPLYYKLVGKFTVPAEDFRDAWTQDRDIAKTKIGDVLVSTVFLVLDHCYDGGEPVLFETMIFGGKHDQEQWRYCTYDEAVKGHGDAVRLVSPTRWFLHWLIYCLGRLWKWLRGQA